MLTLPLLYGLHNDCSSLMSPPFKHVPQLGCRRISCVSSQSFCNTQVSNSSSLRRAYKGSSMRSRKPYKPNSPCPSGATWPPSYCTRPSPPMTPMRPCLPPCIKQLHLASRRLRRMARMTTRAVATQPEHSWRRRWLTWRCVYIYLYITPIQFFHTQNKYIYIYTYIFIYIY